MRKAKNAVCIRDEIAAELRAVALNAAPISAESFYTAYAQSARLTVIPDTLAKQTKSAGQVRQILHTNATVDETASATIT